MQRLEVSCAVRRIYIYIYVVRRQWVNRNYLEVLKKVRNKWVMLKISKRNLIHKDQILNFRLLQRTSSSQIPIASSFYYSQNFTLLPQLHFNIRTSGHYLGNFRAVNSWLPPNTPPLRGLFFSLSLSLLISLYLSLYLSLSLSLSLLISLSISLHLSILNVKLSLLRFILEYFFLFPKCSNKLCIKYSDIFGLLSQRCPRCLS